MTMTEIVDIEIGTIPEIITKETNHGMTVKEIDLIEETGCMEIDHIVEIDHKITMKEIDPITEMIHTVEIDCQTITKMTIEVTIDITTKMIMKMTIEKIIMKEIHPIAETGAEIGYVVGIETTIKMTIEMIIEKKIIGISKTRDMRESIETIMQTSVKTGM